MKLTNEQLLRLIKEEISKIVNEGSFDASAFIKAIDSRNWLEGTTDAQIEDYITKLRDNQVEPNDFGPDDLNWTDLVRELDINTHDARVIAAEMVRKRDQK